MMYSPSKNQPKKRKVGRYVVMGLIVIMVIGWIVGGRVRIEMDGQYIIKQGDTYQTLTDQLGWWTRTKLKYWMRKHADEVPTLKPGIVTFEGSYTPSEWLSVIDESTGKPQMLRLTLLEGWSSYDVDVKLAGLGLIATGDYRTTITSAATVNEYAQQYKWLQQQYSSPVPSLEGYLYPDTYFVDISKDVIPQLITMQLKAYQDKVWTSYSSQILGFSAKLKSDGFTFDLTPYSVMKLASVIENEEKATSNKSTIAGIFLNRIQQGMRLDADVTLCYGKGVTYSDCTPAFIVQNLYEESNPYNTRQVAGLPPTPISNPSVDTITGLLGYAKSNYFFYLHDSSGKIHPAATIEQHNANKAQYLD